MNGLPPSYPMFRSLWSVLHPILLVLLAMAVTWWWFTDSNGAHLVSSWWTCARMVQQAIATAVPFPWE